ncbi:hypothetical protein HPP92_003128 [Vanilla planifolia]|uniref:Uncharacterized protein n=1 Tax=Vanilla planifolia TaxID=51239 RepID=A0A835S7P6_VANPL|nr:hypothetical protein HPP92_003128 [Vanilla planifolia]
MITALGKIPRIYRVSSSSTCSSLTVVMFIALCLVGVWITTYFTVVPVDLSPEQTNKSDFKKQVSHSDSRSSEGDHDKAFTEPSVSKEQHQPESGSDKFGEASSVGNEVKTGDQKDGQNKIAGETDENANSGEYKAIDVSNRNIDAQESNVIVDNNADTTDVKQPTEDRSSGKSENNDDDDELLSKNQYVDGENNVGKNYGFKVPENALKDELLYIDASNLALLNETIQIGSWSTQAAESRNEKELQASSLKGELAKHNWKLCNVTAGVDYIPCLDNEEAIKGLPSTKHYEHRERHCPEKEPTCLVPLPKGYKRTIKWPKSRDKIWYANIPHTKLVEYKGHQNWIKASGEYLTFPGGGTQFKNGIAYYIDAIQKSLPGIAWGKHSRVILDVGCGVASFGGYLFDRDVLTMSLAPKDEHEAQVQFALERGIPAILAVMGTKRLPFPSMVFDVIHCARCRVPWHIEGGILLLELNRILRPGGFFVWSATPIYQHKEEDVGIWKAMSELTKAMCWEMVSKTKDSLNKVGIAIYRKPSNNECYEQRVENVPQLCPESDDPNASWNVPLQACMHRLPEDPIQRGFYWPAKWPSRIDKTPYWLDKNQVGVYGKPSPKDFQADSEHWKRVVSKSYMNGIGIDWSFIRNVMDMRSVYGGFAAALRDLKLWVLNVVPIDSPDTLSIIYERGLFGMYHDWCESFSSYPRTYDLLHADHLFSTLKRRCSLLPVIVEVDRILRPKGVLIVRDNEQTISEIESILKSLHWDIIFTYLKENEGLLFVQKKFWRPTEVEINNASLS